MRRVRVGRKLWALVAVAGWALGPGAMLGIPRGAEAAGAELAPLHAPPDNRPPVVAVELHHPEGFDARGLEGLVSVRAGEPLSLRAVQRSIERLFATGRLADVVVRQAPEGRGIRVIFELAPQRRLAALYVAGASVLSSAEVLEASGLEEGAPFYPETLERAVEAVRTRYRRRGYREARVHAEKVEGPEGVELSVTIEEGAPTRVMGLTFAGSPGLPLSRLAPMLGLGVGDVLDEAVLEPGMERLRELYRSERYFRARVGEPALELVNGAARVMVPVQAGPKFDFHFHGNRSFSSSELSSVLGYDGLEALDRAVMQRLARRVEAFYRYRGFHDVRVTPREVPNPTGSRTVVAFDVSEGWPLYVREIQFDGNRSVSDERLLDVLASSVLESSPLAPSGQVLSDPLGTEGLTGRGIRFSRPAPEPGRVYVAEAYQAAVAKMVEYYRSRGFLSAQVRWLGVELDVAAHTAVAQFRIDEGARTYVSAFRVRGAPAGFQGTPSLGLTLVDPLVASRVEGARQRLLQALARKGYLFARVETETRVLSGGQKGEVDFVIQAGPQVRVGQVILQGVSRSRESMVRRNLALFEGQVLDPESLYASQRNLVSLGIFRQVAVRTLAPDTPEPVKDVVVELRERPRLVGELGGGYSLEDGPRLLTDVTYPNLFGRGVNLSARGKLNYVAASAHAFSGSGNTEALQGLSALGGRGNISLHQPRIYSLLPTQVGARVDLIGERVHRPHYSFSRFASVAGLDWSASEWLTLSLQYELEYDNVDTREQLLEQRVGQRSLEEQRFSFEPGTFWLQSLRPVVTLDFRDDPTQPRLGLLVSGMAELTRDFSATLTPRDAPSEEVTISTLKASGNITGYLPVPPSMVLALSLRAGKIFRIDPHSRTVGPKRFFLGGASSMRGFGEDALLPQDRREVLHTEVDSCRAVVNPAGCTQSAKDLRKRETLFSGGGEIFSLAKAELRIPVLTSFDVGVFFEAGNLWLSPAAFQPLTLRYVSGAGLRYNTPIGPLAFDLGVNLAPDEVVNEAAYALHFSIGLF